MADFRASIMVMMWGNLFTIVAAVTIFASTATAVSPEAKCEAAKNQESGKYALCRHKAEVRLLKTKGACSVTAATSCYRDAECPVDETCVKDPAKYAEAVTKCEMKYAAKWTSAEIKAADASATCPDGLLQADVMMTIEHCVSNVAAGLAGLGMTDCEAGLSDCSGDLADCGDDLVTCTADLDNAEANLGTCQADLSQAQLDLTACNGDVGMCQADLSQAQSDLTACNADVDTCTGDLGDCTADLAFCNGVLGTCGADLAACLAEPPGQRLRTGQTFCYDAFGNPADCAGTGQDGELLKGLTVSYVDHGNGTISDDRTGLMWEKLSDDGSIHDKDATFNFSNALRKVRVLKGDSTGCIGNGNPDACCTAAGAGNCSPFAGYDDWRLPNINELQSLANYGAADPAVHPPFNTSCSASCTVLTCSCTQPFTYWTSTSYHETETIGWRVSFDDGFVRSASKTGLNSARAVRGGI